MGRRSLPAVAPPTHSRSPSYLSVLMFAGASPLLLRRLIPNRPLLQQFRKPPILEHPPFGLLLRAIVHLVLREEDRLDRRPAARAWLTLVRVDAQRLRR